MRALLLAVAVLAGCGAGHERGPAWPKMAEQDKDGGESIAPHASATSVAAAADDDDDDIKIVVAPVADKPAAATPAVTPSVTPTITAPEETITIEDITIEVDD